MHTGVRNDRGSHTGQDHERTSQAVGQDPPGAGGVVSTSSDGWYAGAGQSGSISSDT